METPRPSLTAFRNRRCALLLFPFSPALLSPRTLAKVAYLYEHSAHPHARTTNESGVSMEKPRHLLTT